MVLEEVVGRRMTSSSSSDGEHSALSVLSMVRSMKSPSVDEVSDTVESEVKSKIVELVAGSSLTLFSLGSESVAGSSLTLFR